MASTREPRYVIRFVLVDPSMLKKTGDVEQSTVLTVSGLVKGRAADLEGLVPSQATWLVNRDLVSFSCIPVERRAVEVQCANEGYGVYCFCSRCGRRFPDNSSCHVCRIDFTIRPANQTVANGRLALPDKIAAYARRHGAQLDA